MMPLAQQISALLLAVIAAGGGGGLVAWLAFKKFGEKWLESKFARGLELQRHSNMKELESFKSEINATLDRKLKMQQREFDAVIELWALTNDAFRNTSALANRSYSLPNLDAMSPQDLDYYLKDAEGLSEWQKSKLRSEQKKNDLLMRFIVAQLIMDAQKSYRVFFFYLKRNGIFMPSEFCAPFMELDDLMRGVIAEQHVALQVPGSVVATEQKDTKRFIKEAEAILNKLEGEVRARLAPVKGAA